jgi:hypothetical protein
MATGAMGFAFLPTWREEFFPASIFIFWQRD